MLSYVYTLAPWLGTHDDDELTLRTEFIVGEGKGLRDVTSVNRGGLHVLIHLAIALHFDSECTLGQAKSSTID